MKVQKIFLMGPFSLNAEGGKIKNVQTSPRTRVQAATRDESSLFAENTGLLGEPTCIAFAHGKSRVRRSLLRIQSQL